MVTSVAPGHVRFIERALFLAERGRGRTTPNPLVGAVIVSADGTVVGQGAHLVAGGPHAEIVALTAAGSLARGATLYCTLEPCCHVGRTGPCVERIVAAGIARVVICMRDPNPRVSGGGVEYLRDHGIDVVEDICRERAVALNRGFLTLMRHRRPFVTMKVVTSRDGYVGQRGGTIRLSGAVANRYFHRQRAEIDAIGVGADTVIADDPQLTPRGAYRFRPLARVIFDWRLRVPQHARMFSTLDAGPVIMIVGRAAARQRGDDVERLRSIGVDCEVFDEHDLTAALVALAARDILWLVVEGGPRLHAALVDADLVDHAERLITPHVLGEGIPWWQSLARPPWPSPPDRETALGDDILMEFDVHRLD